MQNIMLIFMRIKKINKKKKYIHIKIITLINYLSSIIKKINNLFNNYFSIIKYLKLFSLNISKKIFSFSKLSIFSI